MGEGEGAGDDDEHEAEGELLQKLTHQQLQSALALAHNLLTR